MSALSSADNRLCNPTAEPGNSNNNSKSSNSQNVTDTSEVDAASLEPYVDFRFTTLESKNTDSERSPETHPIEPISVSVSRVINSAMDSVASGKASDSGSSGSGEGSGSKNVTDGNSKQKSSSNSVIGLDDEDDVIITRCKIAKNSNRIKTEPSSSAQAQQHKQQQQKAKSSSSALPANRKRHMPSNDPAHDSPPHTAHKVRHRNPNSSIDLNLSSSMNSSFTDSSFNGSFGSPAPSLSNKPSPLTTPIAVSLVPMTTKSPQVAMVAPNPNLGNFNLTVAPSNTLLTTQQLNTNAMAAWFSNNGGMNQIGSNVPMPMKVFSNNSNNWVYPANLNNMPVNQGGNISNMVNQNAPLDYSSNAGSNGIQQFAFQQQISPNSNSASSNKREKRRNGRQRTTIPSHNKNNLAINNNSPTPSISNRSILRINPGVTNACENLSQISVNQHNTQKQQKKTSPVMQKSNTIKNSNTNPAAQTSRQIHPAFSTPTPAVAVNNTRLWDSREAMPRSEYDPPPCRTSHRRAVQNHPRLFPGGVGDRPHDRVRRETSEPATSRQAPQYSRQRYSPSFRLHLRREPRVLFRAVHLRIAAASSGALTGAR